MYATRALQMRPTLRMMRPVPKEEQAAHTVSQRLRRLRKIPAELLPLGVVVGFALFAAGYSSMRHFLVDKTIRLKRQNRGTEGGHEEAHH
ncbi:NADH-ubiquinone reductase complex 1 MLRQ subunit [Niveomyces insectorum RCEF 264]|uniref:NADH-ubiquinone reductase complex 1 MLRQ subunit n=1 Tax=Niveomyces insectorum RCEF 264 TaxID=1081102 RepID=A0A167NUB7_9HYPO|nr:NADH-ubiquinone reductase complex 1 MLRQ subunit [Niveomyces insectorum RCEF 264]